MTKEGDIIDMSEYRNKKDNGELEDWEKEVIDEIIKQSEPLFKYLEEIEGAIHSRMEAFEKEVKEETAALEQRLISRIKFLEDVELSSGM